MEKFQSALDTLSVLGTTLDVQGFCPHSALASHRARSSISLKGSHCWLLSRLKCPSNNPSFKINLFLYSTILGHLSWSPLCRPESLLLPYFSHTNSHTQSRFMALDFDLKMKTFWYKTNSAGFQISLGCLAARKRNMKLSCPCFVEEH